MSSNPSTCAVLAGEFGVRIISELSAPAVAENGEKAEQFTKPVTVFERAAGSHLPVKNVAWSPDGRFLAVIDTSLDAYVVELNESGTAVVDVRNVAGAPPTTRGSGFQSVQWAPDSAHVVFWQSYSADEQAALPERGNVLVVNPLTGKVVLRLTQPGGQPNRVAFLAAGAYIAALKPNGHISMWERAADGAWTALGQATGPWTAADSLSASPAADRKDAALAVLTLAGSNSSSRVSFFALDTLIAACTATGKAGSLTPTSALAGRTLSRMDGLRVQWSPYGTSAVILADTQTAGAVRSYYAFTYAYKAVNIPLIATEQRSAQEEAIPWKPRDVSELDLPEKKSEDTIVALSWAAFRRRENAVVLYGRSPTRAALLDQLCATRFDFGTSSINDVSWAPNARLVLLGGYGALGGLSAVWDVNKKRRVGQFTACDTVVHTWAADSRSLLVAVTSPRLRVDNGFSLWSADGECYYQESVNALYAAVPRPAPAGLFTDRPISPARLRRGLARVDAAEQAAAAPKRSFGSGKRVRAFGAGSGGFTGRPVDVPTTAFGGQAAAPVSASAKRRARRRANVNNDFV